MRPGFIIGPVLAVLAFGAPAARAESGPRGDAGPWCGYGAPEIEPPAGDVPSNWPRFLIRLSGGWLLDWSAVRLIRVSDGVVAPTSLLTDALPIVVGPHEPLVVGEEYDLYHPVCELETPRVTRYRAIAPIAAPTSLGTITVSPLYAANRQRGAGYREYFVAVTLTPDPGFDGEPWSAALWASGAGDSGSLPQPVAVHLARVGVECFRPVGLRPGDHVFSAMGYVVPGAAQFVAPDVPTTIAPCAEALRVDYDTLRPLTPDEIVYWDTVDMDAGFRRDASVSTLDAGSLDGGSMDVRTEPDTETGCGCHAVGSAGSRSAACVLAGAALWSVRRRGRRR